MPRHLPTLGSGAIWSVLDNLTQQVLSFAVFLVLARLVVPEDFGLMAISHLIVSLVRQTLLDAIVHPVARGPLPSDALYDSAFSACVLSSLLLSGLMLVAAPFIARFYSHPELAAVVSWMSLVVLLTGASAVYEVRLIRAMEFRPLALRAMVSVTLGGVLGIVLALQGHGVWALLVQQLVTSATALLMLVVQSPWRPRWVWRGLAARVFSPDASRVGLTGLFSFLSNQGDTVIVSLLLGAHATGLYSFAKRLTSTIYLVIGSSLLKLAIPAFATAQHQAPALRLAYTRILGLTFLLMAPLYAGMSVLAEPMIAVFFGPAWAQAAPVIALLSVLHLLLAANQINDYLLFAVGERSAPMLRTALQILFALLFAGLLAQDDLRWIAGGFVLASALVWPWSQWRALRHMESGFSSLAHTLKAPALATVAMGGLLLGGIHLTPPSLMSLLGLVVSGALVYGLVHTWVTQASPASHNAFKDLLQLGQVAPPTPGNPP
jgi:O-antigen/teichoic acid export membrane protein